VLAEVEAFMREAFAVPGDLREEDRRKAAEVAALLPEIGRIARGGRERVLVDLGCGHAYVGLAAAALLPAARLSVIGIDSNPARVRRCEEAAARLRAGGRDLRASFRVSSIRAAALPPEPDIVVALHACGSATDDALACAAAARARFVLAVPCCHRRKAAPRNPHLGVLEALRHRVVQDLARARRLERAGYEVTAVEIWPASVSPANVLLRARRMTRG
jgi:SAM-dependent methyltransferase